MAPKKELLFTPAVLGWLVLFALAGLGAFGVIAWSWWLLLTPIVGSMLGRWRVLRADLILTPLGSRATCISDTHSVRTYVSWYVFGIRILNLHTNR